MRRFLKSMALLGIAGGLLYLTTLGAVFFVAPSQSDELIIPNTFVGGTVADPSQVNANFDSIADLVNGKIDNDNWDTSGPPMDYANMALTGEIVEADLVADYTQNILAQDAIQGVGASESIDRISPLRVYALATPSTAVRVNGGVYTTGNTFGHVNYIGTASFAAPAKPPLAGESRIDVLHLTDAGVLTWEEGVPDVSPVAPAYPGSSVGIAEVWRRQTESDIEDSDNGTDGYILRDIRPFFRGSFTMSHFTEEEAFLGAFNAPASYTAIAGLSFTETYLGGDVLIMLNFSLLPTAAASNAASVYFRLVVDGTPRSGLQTFSGGDTFGYISGTVTMTTWLTNAVGPITITVEWYDNNAALAYNFSQSTWNAIEFP